MWPAKLHSIKLHYIFRESNDTEDVLQFARLHLTASDKVREKHKKSRFACDTKLVRQGENGLYWGYFMPIMSISMRGTGDVLETAIKDYIDCIGTTPMKVSKFFDGGIADNALRQYGKKAQRDYWDTYKKVVDI
jgi:hypothetical protein